MAEHDPQPQERREAQRPERTRTSPAARAARDNMGTLIVAAVVVICALIFILQNRQRVSVSFLSIDITAPIWLLVVGYFVLGGLVVGGLMWARRRGT